MCQRYCDAAKNQDAKTKSNNDFAYAYKIRGIFIWILDKLFLSVDIPSEENMNFLRRSHANKLLFTV